MIALLAIGSGFALFTAAGCSPSRDEPSGGTGRNLPCSATSPCEDDGNPCTKDECTSGSCVRTPLTMDNGPGSTECATIACAHGVPTKTIHLDGVCGAGLTCDEDGQCTGCASASACPTPMDCQVASCVNRVCEVEAAPAGAPARIGVDMPNDCKKSVCDGHGKAVLAADVDDLPLDDGNPCTENACSLTEPAHPPSSVGTACALPGNPSAGVCDGNGACVECTSNSDCKAGMLPSCDLSTHACVSCSDGKQNGSEVGLDCGGDTCPGCDGDVCGQDAECKSAACAGKVCCNVACSGPCVACDLPGKAGACTPVPKGVEDSGCSGGSKACDGAGTCMVGIQGKAGALCSKNTGCYTGACNGMCRLPDLAPCAEDAECATLRCVANACTGCSAGSDCASKYCSAGRCLAPAGGVCSNDSDCAGGMCDAVRNLCGESLGGACAKDSDCSTHYCKAMSHCAACSVATEATDCASHLCDANGSCLLLPEAPCTGGWQCASSLCSAGFPATCQ